MNTRLTVRSNNFLKTNGKLADQTSRRNDRSAFLNGLEFLHSRNIIHRDLKPANILLQGTTPRLADFGISRAMKTTMASQSQHISGTFAYMSPEALDGRRSVQTDIWSVGVNLYQFLTGSLPFPQKEPSVLFPAIIMREFEPLPDFVPSELKRIITKSLAKLPEDRYKTVNELGEDLRRILQSEQEEEETVIRPAQSFRKGDKRIKSIVLMYSIFLLLLLVSISLFIYFLQQPTAQSGISNTVAVPPPVNNVSNIKKATPNVKSVNSTSISENPVKMETISPLAQVVSNYYTALKRKDDAALRRVFSQSTLRVFETDMKDENKTSLAAYITESEPPPEKPYEVRNERIEGNIGTAEIKGGVYPNGIRVKFIRESGIWKMTNEAP